MKRQHRQTLQALYAHPLQHGLRCSLVEGMLLSLGAEVERLSDHRLQVRLDHRGADLWHLVGEAVEQAELEPHGLWGGDQNLSHRHERDIAGQCAPLDHAYLEGLSDAIAQADAVLLLGHGHGQADVRQLLVAHLRRHHPQLLQRIVGVVTVDDSALSEAELLALAREHFGNQPHRRPLATPGQERREAP